VPTGVEIHSSHNSNGYWIGADDVVIVQFHVNIADISDIHPPIDIHGGVNPDP
jgi:hypothetical protein